MNTKYEVKTVRLGTAPLKDHLDEHAAKGWKLFTVQIADKAAWVVWELPE